MIRKRRRFEIEKAHIKSLLGKGKDKRLGTRLFHIKDHREKGFSKRNQEIQKGSIYMYT